MELRAGIEGRVIVQFVVHPDGHLSDFQVVRSVTPGLDAAAVEAIRTQARFRPGRQRGVAVRVRFTIPVTFRLEG
jgi:protein TonB